MTLSVSSVIISEILEFGWSVVVLLPITCRYLFLHWFEHWSLLIIYIFVCIYILLAMCLPLWFYHPYQSIMQMMWFWYLTTWSSCHVVHHYVLYLYREFLCYIRSIETIYDLFSVAHLRSLWIFSSFLFFSFRLYAFFLVPDVGIAQQRWQFFF